jgi:hypothetical protein
MKDLVYQMKVQDVDELRHQIAAAYKTVTPVMLKNTWQEVEYHLDICLATKGPHTEIYRGAPELGNFLYLSLQFPCFYLHPYYFRKNKILLLV